MKRDIIPITLLVLVIWLFSTLAPSAEQADITPASVAASSTLAITGPTDPIEVGEEVYLRIEGLTLAEVVAAQDAKLFDLTAFPLRGLKIKASYDWMFRTLDLEFRAKNPGGYIVKLHLVRDGKLEIAAIEVEVGGDSPEPPGPDPPTPDPDPPIPTPGPLDEMWVIVVEESSDRTTGQAQVLFTYSLANWLSQNGHHFRLVDQDQPATDLSTWIAQAEQHDLPRLFLVGEDGEAVHEGPLPETIAEMMALVKKWGVEK